jgi:hypothetical protein
MVSMESDENFGSETEPGNPQAEGTLEITKEYRASPRYWVLAIAGLGAAALLLIDLFRGVRWDTALFALIGLVGGLWALWMATTRVYVTDDGLIIKRFTAAYRVDFQQMLGADVQGRFLSVLSIVFHPRLESGLIDTEQVGSMLVPALVDQEQLVELIEHRIPA